jgi:protoporphyrinogen/coproporphyrinogen III oxidase
MKRIGIVGAGISGLVAAWTLKRARPDASIAIFEASDRIGGVIRTQTDPYLIEWGADNFGTLIPDALHLVREMGLESEFIGPQKNFRIAQVVQRGRLVPIPNGFSLMQPTRIDSILATPILSVGGKLRVLAERWIPRRRDTSDESVADFAIRRLGRECYQRLVEPIVGGIFTARAETLSMQAAMPQFVAMEREYGSLIRAAQIQRRERSSHTRSAQGASGARYDQFIAPRRGMSWWMGELAAPIREELHLKTRVASIRRAEDGVWVVRSIAMDTGESRVWSFDQLCMATPSYVAAELLAGTDPALADELARVPYASSAIAVLAVKKEEIRPDAFCFGAIVPAIEHRDCLAISLTSEKYDGRCPSDLVLARVFLGGAVRSELVDESDASLLVRAKRELQALFGPSSPPVYESLIRWPRSMPQYLVGHPQRVVDIMERVASLQGLELIGNAYDGVGIPQCVRGARNAVQRMAKRCGTLEQ